ncbi:MAG: SIR2 family protein [Chloroflexi bacterium]|nr:SIR2 family protein [Chloroflexota bacterium]
MNKVCVILGAGASSDVHNDGSRLIDEKLKPPLARELFDIKHREAFWEFINEYEGARFFASLLEPVLSSGERSIEQKLREYAGHKDPSIRKHFKDVPPYLRDLLQAVSNRYTYVPGNYIRLNYELLSEHQHEVIFIVLNYDTFLEKALTIYDKKNYRFSDINEYVVPSRQANIIKLHGSVNWFWRIPNSGSGDWKDVVAKYDVFDHQATRDILLLNGERTYNVRTPNKSDFVYPVITAPLARKNISDSVCPGDHINAAKLFLKGCHKFLIIGTSGLDEDLLSHLNTMVGAGPHFLHIVDTTRDNAQKVLSRFQNGVKGLRGAILSRGSGVTFGDGFQKYLSSHDFMEFVKYDI